MQDNMKHNNIHIIGIPEGEEEEQGIENLGKSKGRAREEQGKFEKVMMENFPNLRREKVTQIQESQRVPTRGTQRDPLQHTSSLKWQISKTKKES